MLRPYLSDPELVNAPTGINWKNIPIRAATDAQQLDERTNLIIRATEWADQFVQQGFDPVTDFTLAATQNLDVTALAPNYGSRARWLRDGSLKWFSRYLPIISVDTVEWSFDAVEWTSFSGFGTVLEGIQSARIIPGNNFQYSGGAPGFGDPSTGWIRVGYTNGFPNTVLTGAVLAAGTSLPLEDVTGIRAGSVLTIADGPSRDERVTVSASHVAATGAGSVVVSALAYGHAAGIAVHAMRGVRQAAIEAVRDLVSDRGYEGITLAPTGRGLRPVEVRADSSHPAATSSALAKAMEFLKPWRRVV